MNGLRRFFSRDAVKGAVAVLGVVGGGIGAAVAAALVPGPTWVRAGAAFGAFLVSTSAAFGALSGGTTNLQPVPRAVPAVPPPVAEADE